MLLSGWYFRWYFFGLAASPFRMAGTRRLYEQIDWKRQHYIVSVRRSYQKMTRPGDCPLRPAGSAILPIASESGLLLLTF
jgi:hypothetical protein